MKYLYSAVAAVTSCPTFLHGTMPFIEPGRPAAHGAWYLCDDSYMLQENEATACSPNAYLLYQHSGGTGFDLRSRGSTS